MFEFTGNKFITFKVLNIRDKFADCWIWHCRLIWSFLGILTFFFWSHIWSLPKHCFGRFWNSHFFLLVAYLVITGTLLWSFSVLSYTTKFSWYVSLETTMLLRNALFSTLYELVMIIFKLWCLMNIVTYVDFGWIHCFT